MPPFHPDLRAAARWLPRTLVNSWTVKLMRLLPSPGGKLPPGVTVNERALPSGARVRVLSPAEHSAPRPAVVWIHGGGYVIGNARQDDAFCGRLATELGAVVISVDYRLAPEAPFPAPLDDCFAAFVLLHHEAAVLGIDPTRVALAGQSAGGGLAAALAQRVRDSELPAPVFQLLIYPMLDDRTVLRDTGDRDVRVWSPASNRLGWTAYLGCPPGAESVPDYTVPARRSDMRGLPPAWIGVGTNDLFHDEDLAYAERLREAGVSVVVEVVPGAFHGFETVAPDAPVSRAFVQAQIDALAGALGRPSGP